MKKTEAIYEVINGNYFLNSPDYVFVVSGNGFAIKHKDVVRSYENVIIHINQFIHNQILYIFNKLFCFSLSFCS